MSVYTSVGQSCRATDSMSDANDNDDDCDGPARAELDWLPGSLAEMMGISCQEFPTVCQAELNSAS